MALPSLVKHLFIEIEIMDNSKYIALIKWCETNDNIRTVILTSSRANPNSSTDILSDYDIELYVNEILPFSTNDDWLKLFGPIMFRWPLKPESTWSANWLTRLIQFRDGTRIDFQITEQKPEYHSNFDAGYKVVIDKDNNTVNIKKADYKNLFIKKPTQLEFQKKVNAFFWDILYVAKSLWRDELFYAKYMFDNVIRFNFLQIIVEWYIGLNHNWEISTNKCGRYFKQYLEPEIWKQIEETFTGAQISENWKALYKMIEIFSLLAKNISKRLNFDYPDELEKNVIDYIKKIQFL